MNISRKVLTVLALGIFLSGCASTQNTQELSPKISFAPAIDVSYEEVVANIDQNIGTDVRWGGKVIESESIEQSTVRLTVFAYPLSSEGRPTKTDQANEKGGRFIVDLADGFAKEANFDGHLLTFYGNVASSVVLTNGKRKKSFPVINAQELVDWNLVDDENSQYTNKRRGNAYYGLNFGTGYFGYRALYGYPYSYGGGRYGHSSIGFYSRGYRSYGHRSHRSHRSHRKSRH